MIRFLSAFALVSFLMGSMTLTSCRTYEITDASNNEVGADETLDFQNDNPPFTFLDVKIEEDSLIVLVQYSGGCGNHEFEIEKVGFLMKSLPPKQPIRIIHRSDNDPCRSLIQEELKFDVSSFRGTPDGITVLILENWPLHINYSY
ncbi:MAG: hypothetical protein COA49_02480 [Bacteroidetes bacterium]|nr:MAG: hypothetical protein COA49_02480 [Bacteroidota bacterium]